MGTKDLPRITKESVTKSIMNAARSTIGTPMGGTASKTIKSVTGKTLRDLTDAGVLNTFEMGKVQTKHQSKNLLGRVGDFFRWKTPWRRWYYKPFYVQVDLADKLTELKDYSDLPDLSDVVFEVLVQSVRGVKVWEKRYPEDPYSVILTDFSVTPSLPVEHISMRLTL